MRIFGENADAVDLVFLDMMMLGLSGVEVLERIRRIRPKSRPWWPAATHWKSRPRIFLAKPYSPLDLVRRIQDVLSK
jgi:response regulator RpfG family c-di-GMP phosphodiesterase